MGYNQQFCDQYNCYTGPADRSSTRLPLRRRGAAQATEKTVVMPPALAPATLAQPPTRGAATPAALEARHCRRRPGRHHGGRVVAAVAGVVVSSPPGQSLSQSRHRRRRRRRRCRRRAAAGGAAGPRQSPSLQSLLPSPSLPSPRTATARATPGGAGRRMRRPRLPARAAARVPAQADRCPVGIYLVYTSLSSWDILLIVIVCHDARYKPGILPYLAS